MTHASERTPATATVPVPARPFIRLQHVSKVFQMGATRVTALRALDLAIPRGSFTAVIGRSGSGKSTLLHLLAAMEAPSSGVLEVGDWHLACLDRRDQARYRREMVGMIFQQFNLVPSMTALQNAELPLLLAGVSPSIRRARAEVCLELVGLTHRLHHRPPELSGGEQQRVAIARALTGDPPLLLADEPTGNLDSTTGAQIIDLLADVHLKHEKTVVVVTHHLDEVAALADRVVTLHDGALQEPA